MKTPKDKPLQKQKYEKPKVVRVGTLQELSQTVSVGGSTDGGSVPNNKMHCITQPSVIEEHRILLADQACQNSFREEIQNTVRPGDIVCDLGAGSGIHTLFALKAGASKVYAIDIDPLIYTAQEVLLENGLINRVVFIKGNSKNIELPEKVDVLISNIGFLHTLNDVPDAIRRFLKPEGRTIPEAVSLSLTPVAAENLYNQNVAIWDKKTFGFNFSAFKNLACNHPLYWIIPPEDILALPFNSEPIYLKQNIPKVHSWDSEFTFEKKCKSSGIGGWYSFYSRGHEFLTTKPPLNMSQELWSNFFLPFTTPLILKPGDRLKINLEMHREVLGESPVWIWRTTLNNNLVSEQNSFVGTPTDLNAHLTGIAQVEF